MSFNSPSTLSTGALAALVMLSPQLTHAQSSEPDETGSSEAERRFTPVTVSATRRDQSALDVPISITALSGDDLVRNAQDDLADYIRQVPGVAFRQQSAGLNEISIRGVSGGGGQRAKAPISFYVDDVPVISDPVASPDVKTFDVERVEVLRGPQGTLFGESALGGVIRVLTNQPDLDTFESRARLSYISFDGGDDGYNFDGMVNLPIIEDELAIRATLSRRDEGGWIDNLGIGGRDNQNDLDYTSGRVKALWQVNPDLSISATASLTNSEYGSRQSGTEDFEQFIDFTDETRTDDMEQFNVTVKYDFGFAELTSSSNTFDRETSRLFNLNFFNGFLPGILESLGAVEPGFQYDEFAQTLNIDDSAFVQEIRLVSPGDKSFRWVTGVYYYDTDNFVGVDFFGAPQVDFQVLRLRRDEAYEQRAIFGEVEYDFAANWTAIFGLRYTEEERSISYNQQDDFPFVVFLPANGEFQVDLDYEILTPRFVLQYRPTDSSQIYASASRGFRGPGGNTDFDDAGVRNNSYGAESIWSYELGGKSQLLNNRLSLEAAVFYTDWSDRQEVVNPGAPFTEQFSDNIGSAEISGLELASSYIVNDYLTIGGSATLLDTEIVDSGNPVFEGQPITAQADERASAFIDFAYPLSNGLTLTLRGDGIYSGEVIYDLSNPVSEGDYTILNASAGIEGDGWTASLFSRNIANEFIRYGAGLDTSIGEPRVIGASIDVTF